MNDFEVSKDWIHYSDLGDEVIADAMDFLKPKCVRDMLHFHAEKWVMSEVNMLPIMRMLDEISSKLEWHYFQREDDVYFQVYVTPRQFDPS
jgi:hypothetical protein